MTVCNLHAGEAASLVEALAAFLAEIDEVTPATADEIAARIRNIVLDGTTPETVREAAAGAALAVRRFKNGESGFDAFYEEICEKTREMQKAAEENTGAPEDSLSEPVPEEESTDLKTEPAETETAQAMSVADVEDLRMQFEVLEGLFEDFRGGNRHLADVFSNILAKTLSVPGLPGAMRLRAEEAGLILGLVQSGDAAPEEAYERFAGAVTGLRAALEKAAGTGEQDAVAEENKSGVVLISDAEIGIALLEKLEPEILAFENGGAGAAARIAGLVKEIRHSVGNDLPTLAKTFLNGVASRLEKGGIARGTEAVNPLLEMKDLLFDFFNARAAGKKTALSEEAVTSILSRLNAAAGGGGKPAAPRTGSPGAAAIKLPEVNIRPGNPEMLEFVSETREYIQGAESAMMALETDPGAVEHLNEVFRCFHNIKGISGFLELRDAQMLSHEAESMMERARKGEIVFTGVYAALAFEALDMFKEIVDRVQAAHDGAKYEIPEGFAGLLLKLRNPESAGSEARETSEPQAVAAAARDAASLPKPGGNGSSASPGTGLSLRDTMVKLSTARLDNLIDTVGELVIANAMVSQEHRKKYKVKKDREMAQKMAHLEKITRELQEMAMSLRMVSLQSTFQKLARVARDTSIRSGVPVEFSFSGDETELDRNVVEEISSPLVHMVRNAIDHGIERPEERRASGKPEKGKVHISADHEGGSVVLRISDDGGGLDRKAILGKAFSTGLAQPGADLPDKDIFEMIFHPGFSTAEKVTDISGRGVGMDVVKRTIENMRGRVEINSEAGAGTTFTIRLPLTLAIIDGMVITVGEEKYIIPTIAIQESIRPRKNQLSTVAGKGEMIVLRDNLIPLFRLHELFDIRDAKKDPREALAIVVGENGSRCALLVDNLLGQQQVVIKSIGKLFDNVDGVSGGAIMGDGSVALILDTPGLVRLANRQ